MFARLSRGPVGPSKERDHYQDVCVVLNPTLWKEHQRGNLPQLTALSRNKLYVACTRARGDLYFQSEGLLKGFRAR